jgi:hypothetical protein
MTSPIWAKLMPRSSLFRFSSVVSFIGFLFPMILMGTHFHVIWVYLAYFAYGILQAGSELSWHLSGPMFAQEEDSSFFSSVNVLMVGLRGCAIPYLGSFLCLFFSSTFILGVGAMLCLSGCLFLLKFNKEKSVLLKTFSYFKN